jgi:hypothetical protein
MNYGDFNVGSDGGGRDQINAGYLGDVQIWTFTFSADLLILRPALIQQSSRSLRFTDVVKYPRTTRDIHFLR